MRKRRPGRPDVSGGTRASAEPSFMTRVSGGRVALRRNTMALVLILLVWTAIFVPHLGTLELRGEEGRRTLPAVEMLKNGNWIVPYMAGHPYYNKPPMINWIVAGGILLTGQQNEWAVRLPSIVFVLAFALMVLLVPNRAFDLNRRFLAALLYLTTWCIMEKSRFIEIEGVYVSMTGMALYWWLRGHMGKYGLWSMWIGSGVFLALGMLTKGPMILLVFYAMVLFIAGFEKKWRLVFHPAHWVSLVIWVAPFLIWANAAAQYTPCEEMVSTWGNQMLIRFFPTDFILGDRFEILYRTIFYLMPWLVCAPLCWNKSVLTALEPGQRPILKGLRWSFVACILFIALMPGAYARYSMPLVPLYCLMLAWIIPLDPTPLEEMQKWITTLRRVSMGMPLVTIICLVVVGIDAYGLLVLALTLLCAMILWKVPLPQASQPQLVTLWAVLFSLTMSHYVTFSTIIKKPFESRRPYALAVNAKIPEGETLYIFDPGNQQFLFYLREPLKYIVEPNGVSEQVHYLLIREQSLKEQGLDLLIQNRQGRILYDFLYRDDRGHFLLYRLGPDQDEKVGGTTGRWFPSLPGNATRYSCGLLEGYGTDVPR